MLFLSYFFASSYRVFKNERGRKTEKKRKRNYTQSGASVLSAVETYREPQFEKKNKARRSRLGFVSVPKNDRFFFTFRRTKKF